MILKKIYKYYEYAITKIMLVFKQKTFSDGDVRLKYIWEKSEKKDLIIVFSSCTRQGIKARYNYMRTLSGIDANKLFILDNFADDGRGSWYLGRNCTFIEEKATEKLVTSVSVAIGAEKKIFCGSSKGGYAAFDFGSQFDKAYIVAGAPQYYLGHYLSGPGAEFRLIYILGEDYKQKLTLLDEHLSKRLQESKYKGSQKVYIHYSDQESTYTEHVKDLLTQLTENGHEIVHNIEKYTDHSLISMYFPGFLKKSVEEILK